MAYIARAHLQAQSVPFLSCLSWVYHNNALPVGIGDLLDMPGISSGGIQFTGGRNCLPEVHEVQYMYGLQYG